MKEACVTVQSLTKRYGTQTVSNALHQVNLTINKGDIYGIIGTSGAGKSTLMRCLIGLEHPTDGKIFIEGEEISKKKQAGLNHFRQKIGMVFQHFHLFSSRTVASNVAYPLEIYGVPLQERQQRVSELLSLVGLEDKAAFYPSQLSGGEKQRVGIARALANRPHLLFCDEPTSALDSQTTRSFLQLLEELNRKLNLTIIIITHQLEIVKQICNRVAVLYKGEVVEEGPVLDVFTQPTHSITYHLLGLDVHQMQVNHLISSNSSTKLVRLGFKGHQAQEPIISHMIRRYHIEANILFGGLEYLQKTLVGHLTLELVGPTEQILQALDYLRSQHINCEILS